MLLDYAALEATQVAEDPFRHIVVPRFLPEPALSRIVAQLPDPPGRGSFPIESLKMPREARALFSEMEGPAFRDAVARKFGLDLADAPTMITLRGHTTSRDGQIHCDSTAKRVTVLLYLNPAAEQWDRQEGCLRLLRNGTDLENFAVEVPPVNGTLLVFPNSAASWHGHRPFSGKRVTVQLNYMTTDAKARSEMRRHRISAFLKRLKAA